jgi:AcrR family transcriptional regulator
VNRCVLVALGWTPRRLAVNGLFRRGYVAARKKAPTQTKKRKRGTARRMGPAGSDNWHAMLDGAEKVLREEGYGALTSRRIADHLGIKQRLVYYYFTTMDALIVEMFRRLAVRELESLRKAASAQRPLTEIWYIGFHTTDSPVITEFMALANRIPALRTEVIAFIEESRRIQVTALAAALKKKGVQPSLPPAAMAIIASSVALSVGREAALGTTSGHAAVMEVIWKYLGELDS